MTSKYNKLLDDLQDEDGQISLPRMQLEYVAKMYHLEKLEEPQKTHYIEKIGPWIFFGIIFFIGLSIGWNWAVSSVCDSQPNNLLICIDHDSN